MAASEDDFRGGVHARPPSPPMHFHVNSLVPLQQPSLAEDYSTVSTLLYSVLPYVCTLLEHSSKEPST